MRLGTKQLGMGRVKWGTLYFINTIFLVKKVLNIKNLGNKGHGVWVQNSLVWERLSEEHYILSTLYFW